MTSESKREMIQFLKRLSILIEGELMPIKRNEPLITAAYLNQRKVTDEFEAYLRSTE